LVAITYNFTEAGFKAMNPVWFFLLLAIIGIPELWGDDSSPEYELEEEEDLLNASPIEEMRYSRPY
jgi:hypothetical protein